MELTLQEQPQVKKHPKIVGNLEGLLKSGSKQQAGGSATEVSGNTGILLLGLGHPFYGEMAANLAMSLKHSGCPPVHLVHHGQAIKTLTPDKLALFDSMSECPQEAFMKKGKVAYFKAKTWMYDLSPFDKTLFLDADMLWISNRERSVHDIIASLADVDFTIQNRESFDLANPESEKAKWMWGKISELRKQFTTGKLYSLHSECVWFKKCDRIKEYFQWVKEIFDKPESFDLTPSEFAGDIADEFAFAVAMLYTGVSPHKEPFHPVYWARLDSKMGSSIVTLKDKFSAISFGGKEMGAPDISKYKTMVRGYGQRMGIRRPHIIQPKRKFLKERKAL